jgi:hypothetical protein
MITQMAINKPSQANNQLTLIDWADSKRAFPVPFGRASLFRVGDSREPREMYLKVQIATTSDYSLSFTGQELRIDDEDVLLQLLHLAKGQEVSSKGFKVTFSSRSMLEVLGWGVGGNSHDRLRSCIERLQNGSISLKRLISSSVTRLFFGSFISSAFLEEAGRSSKWVVYINEDSAKLLMPRAELHWPSRIALRLDLSKWLQTFIESESLGAYQDHGINELMRLSGSRAKNFSNFKTSLKRALIELEAKKVIEGYEFITTHVVRITVNQEEQLDDLT